MFQPTEAFNFIFANQRQMSLFYFFLLGGAVSGIEKILKSDNYNNPYNYPHLGISILMGAALGWISYYLAAYFLSYAGDLMKGKANDRDFRVVVAWSLVPAILSLLVIIPQFIFYGAGSNNFNFDAYFTSEKLPLTALIIIKGVLGIWSVVILVKGIAYIQNFSIGKAILNIILPVLVILDVVLLFVAIISIGNFS